MGLNTQIVDQAVADFAAGQSEKAQVSLSGYLALHREDADAWFALGLIRVRSGNIPDGLTALQLVARLLPMQPNVYRELAIVYSFIHDLDRSKACAVTADSLESDLDIDLSTVFAASARGDYAQVLAIGAQILAARPSAIRVYYEMALAHQAHNDYDLVVSALKAITLAVPACVAVSKALADFSWTLKKLDRMSSSYSRQILGQAPGRAIELNAAEIDSYYKLALQFDPRWSEAHVYYANYLRDCGYHDAASSHYRIAENLDPHDPVTHFNLGLALEAVGEKAAAEAEIESAILIKPDFGEAHECLARILEWKTNSSRIFSHYSAALGCARFYSTQVYL